MVLVLGLETAVDSWVFKALHYKSGDNIVLQNAEDWYKDYCEVAFIILVFLNSNIILAMRTLR